MFVPGKGWEASIIDYILCSQSTFPRVLQDQVYAESGAALARSDHNLLSLDAQVAQAVNAAGPGAPASAALHERHPPSLRKRYRVTLLSENRHDDHSRALAAKNGHAPHLSPRDIFVAELNKSLPEVDKLVQEMRASSMSLRKDTRKQAWRYPYAQFGLAVQNALDHSVGSYPKTAFKKPPFTWSRLSPALQQQLNSLHSARKRLKQARLDNAPNSEEARWMPIFRRWPVILQTRCTSCIARGAALPCLAFC